QAIISANTTGGPGSTITFTVAGTINLASSLPPIGPDIVTISTGGNAVTINGNNLHQALFVVPGATSLAISSNLSLFQVASIGGRGGWGLGDGGGGGLGAGAGLFVGDGRSVDITGLSFATCSAVGGAGGNATGAGNGGGGGGGMSQGNGGNTGGASGGGG